MRRLLHGIARRHPCRRGVCSDAHTCRARRRITLVHRHRSRRCRHPRGGTAGRLCSAVGCCTSRACVHPPAACRRRAGAAGLQ
eukprot:7878858-Heterocapsa_arctica.AAC.1